MSTLKRSLLIGLAYGLAVAILDFGLGGYRMANMRLPLGTMNTIRAAAMEVGFGVILGLLATPLCIAFRRPYLPTLAIGLIWIALSRAVAPDPNLVKVWLTAPAAGLILVAAGYGISRRFPRIAWGGALLALAVAIAYPAVVNRSQSAELSAMRSELEQGTAPEDTPDVVVVVLDTVRAANMSTYGYDRETTPYFTELAAESALYFDAVAPSTWSLPSHGSLFTGWFPSAHKVHGEHRMLGPHPPTLGDVLYRNGFDTLSFTANPHISDSFGLSRGFAWSDKAYLSGSGGRSFLFVYRLFDLFGISAQDKGGAQVAGNFERWLADRSEESRPAFVFINFLEAHFPYHQTPADFLAKFTDASPSELRRFSLETFGAQFGRTLTKEERLRAIGPTTDMYDAGILYSDYLLSRVVEALRESGRLDNTILVVLADHGEMLGEQQAFGHVLSLHEPDLHVPLLIRYPSAIEGGTEVRTPVSTVGVFPTVLDLLDIESPSPSQATNLIPEAEGDAVGQPVIAERFANSMRLRTDNLDGQPLERNIRYRIFRSGRLKLVQTDTGERFLFDLDEDAQEQNNLATSRPELLAELEAGLAGWVERLDLPAIDAEVELSEEPEMDEATRERLKALGYVE